MDRQSLRDWVYRFNQAGPEGLHDHKSPGAVPQLTAVERVALAEIVEAGPDSDGVVRWRRLDPQDLVVAFDVMEHIEPHCLDDVLAHIQSKALKHAVFLIANVPAKSFCQTSETLI